MAATIEQISKLLDEKLDAKLDVLRKEITADIEKKLQAKIDENTRNILGNTASIEGHSQQFENMEKEHRAKVEEQRLEIENLTANLQKQNDELDELANRTMRGNIVVRGLPEDPKEDWSATKNKLCDYLSSLTSESAQDIYYKIDRAHRSGKRVKGKPRNVYANFTQSVDASYYVEQSAKHNMKSKANNKNNEMVRIDHQFTKSLEDRRNKAMIKRRELLDGKMIAKGHLVYPAKLMVKVDHNQTKWDLAEEF